MAVSDLVVPAPTHLPEGEREGEAEREREERREELDGKVGPEESDLGSVCLGRVPLEHHLITTISSNPREKATFSSRTSSLNRPARRSHLLCYIQASFYHEARLQRASLGTKIDKAALP